MQGAFFCFFSELRKTENSDLWKLRFFEKMEITKFQGTNSIDGFSPCYIVEARSNGSGLLLIHQERPRDHQNIQKICKS